MPSFARLLGVALGLAATLNVSVTAWRLLDSPLRYDEASFAVQSAGIVANGVPMTIVDGVVVYGMWHPPLYLYSLAFFRSLLGVGDWATRLAGVVWFAGTAMVMWRAAGPWALSLALLSPLVLQGIFFVDIDNTSLAFAVALFAAIFATGSRPYSHGMLASLAGAFLLALWSKLTTPYVVLIAAGTFLLLNREPKWLFTVAAVGAGATAAFLAGYFVYCELTGYPWRFMFDFTYLGKRSSYLSTEGRSVVKLLHAVWWNIIWFAPALSALLALMTFDRARAYVNARRLAPVDFWLILAWAIVGAYAVWANVMGKYTFPAAVAASIALGLWLPKAIADVRLRQPRWLALATASLAAFHALAIPPLVIKTMSVQGPALTIAHALAHPRNIALAALAGGFAVFGVVALRSLSGPVFGRIAAALSVCAIVTSVIDTPKVMLSADDRSPYRAFAERGFDDAVERLNTLAAADKLIGPKDIGYYFRGRSYALDGIRYTPTGETDVVELIQRAGIGYAIDSTQNPVQDSDALFRRAGLVPVEQAGDFVIYGRPR